MADRNYTTDEILAEVRAQKGEIASLSAAMGGIKARLNAALAGEISPKGQAILNDIMSEMQGNSRAMANAVLNTDDDPNNDVDENGTPINQAGAGDPNSPIKGPAETDKAPTTTTLQTTKAVANIGEEITLSAGVTAASGTDKAITGMVTFATEAGAIGRAGLDSTGVAAMKTTVPAGDHSITATYGGDDNFASSTSEAITQSALDPNQQQGSGPTGAQVDPATQQPAPGSTGGAPQPAA